MKKTLASLCLVTMLLTGLSALAAPNIDQEIYQFLAGDARPSGGGGGIVLRKSDEISCMKTKINAPRGPMETRISCHNSDGQSVTGTLANAVMEKIDALEEIRGGGGLVVVKTGVVECAYAQSGTAQGPQYFRYTCN